MHLMTLLGIGFAGVSALLALRTLWLWLSGAAVPGFTTVILLLILIGAILMIGLGVIGAYIAQIYEEVKGRPRFIIREELGGRAAGGRDRTGRTAVAAAQAHGSRPEGPRSAA